MPRVSVAAPRRAYRAVLFDLFGTLIFLNPLRAAGARGIGDPSQHLRRAVRLELPGTDFAAFVKALRRVSAEIEEERRVSHRECPSPERFRRALIRVGAPGEWSVAERLCRAHMRGLAACAEVPSTHVAWLRSLAPRLRLGVVSNFDYAPMAHAILRRCGLAELLDPIVISEELGVRKPHPEIFLHAVAALAMPRDDVLFVGDTPVDDVQGARGAGLDVAWVNRDGAPFPEELAPPTFEIETLVAVAPMLEP